MHTSHTYITLHYITLLLHNQITLLITNTTSLQYSRVQYWQYISFLIFAKLCDQPTFTIHSVAFYQTKSNLSGGSHNRIHYIMVDSRLLVSCDFLPQQPNLTLPLPTRSLGDRRPSVVILEQAGFVWRLETHHSSLIIDRDRLGDSDSHSHSHSP